MLCYRPTNFYRIIANYPEGKQFFVSIEKSSFFFFLLNEFWNEALQLKECVLVVFLGYNFLNLSNNLSGGAGWARTFFIIIVFWEYILLCNGVNSWSLLAGGDPYFSGLLYGYLTFQKNLLVVYDERVPFLGQGHNDLGLWLVGARFKSKRCAQDVNWVRWFTSLFVSTLLPHFANPPADSVLYILSSPTCVRCP